MLPELHLVVGGTRVIVATHALAVAVGVGVGAVFAVSRAGNGGRTLGTVALVAVAALAGARLVYRALHGGGGGLASTGGVATGLAAAWVVARLAGRSVGETLDVVVPAGLLALAVGRIGCFLGGCCYGRPTELPWGLSFPELGTAPRHPLQLYSAVGDVLVLAVAGRRRALAGTAARRTCVGYGLLRAGLECLRDPGATDLLPGGWLTLPQAAALGLAAVAAMTGHPCASRDLRLCLPRSRSQHTDPTEE